MDLRLSSLLLETRTKLNYYQVIEEVYTGRPSRILYVGKTKVAQSGIPLDGIDLMLFEYNQRLVELISQLKPQEILLVGGGAYTLPTYLSKKYPNMHIDIVEPDEELDDIAKKHFNFKLTKNIKLFHDYGLNYIKHSKKSYDLIILDAYIEQGTDQGVPDEIASKKFAKLASSRLNKGGLLAANVISDLKPDSAVNNLHSKYKKYFSHFKVYTSNRDRTYFYSHNLIYVAAAQPITVKLKYEPLSRSDFNQSLI